MLLFGYRSIQFLFFGSLNLQDPLKMSGLASLSSLILHVPSLTQSRQPGPSPLLIYGFTAETAVSGRRLSYVDGMKSCWAFHAFFSAWSAQNGMHARHFKVRLKLPHSLKMFSCSFVRRFRIVFVFEGAHMTES